MPTRVVILPEAESEARAAFELYRERNPVAAQRFEDAVEGATELIMERPFAWPVDDAEVDTRHFVLQRFPYSVVYRVADETVTIVAVAHQRRSPGYWRGR